MDLVEVQKRNSKITVRHPWEDARIEVVKELLKDVLKDRSDFNVLDIGCGDIYVISKLSDVFPEINFYAIDIAFTPQIIESLKMEAGSRKIYLFNSLQEADLQIKGKADLVLLLDVVEHIEDDKLFLRTLHKSSLITEQTHVMITVPAFQSLFCSHDHFLGHYRRYTNKTLLATLQETGFSKIKLGYFFSILVPPRVLQVLKEKMIKPNLNDHTTGLVEWNKGKLITGMIKGILLLDFWITHLIKRITGLSIYGLSNYILCKKQG